MRVSPPVHQFCRTNGMPSFHQIIIIIRPISSAISIRLFPVGMSLHFGLHQFDHFGDHFCSKFEPENISLEELEKQISRDSLITYDRWKMVHSEEANEQCQRNESAMGPSVDSAGRTKAGKGKRNVEQKERRPSECVVCSRAASCCHFDVPSCLGCRSFFRRSILSQRQYQCLHNGLCRIDQGEMCRSCRLDRCILAGMNVRAIRDIFLKLDMDRTISRLEARKAELMERREGEGRGNN